MSMSISIYYVCIEHNLCAMDKFLMYIVYAIHSTCVAAHAQWLPESGPGMRDRSSSATPVRSQRASGSANLVRHTGVVHKKYHLTSLSTSGSHDRTGKDRTGQDRTEDSRAEQSRAE